MKTSWWIGLFFVVVLAGCNRSLLRQRADLAAIDSLMQTRPDSALSLLLDEPVDDPYYQLLLSEALYKNDNPQLNRSELLEAMDYFDSVDVPFLAARCHYMNGVGYYEMDSVVRACEEYLKALEIMDEHFGKRETVGDKAKFMALAHTHLCLLFSDQYLHEQAIYFGEQSLPFYKNYNAPPSYITWVLVEIGSHFNMMNQWDSASFYYEKAMDILPDTNTLVYRDIETSRALLQYYLDGDAQKAQIKLNHLINLVEDKRELLARYLNISEVFFIEKQYDSAVLYLTDVFYESSNIDAKKQAAKWLMEICLMQDRSNDTQVYSDYLAQFATPEENSINIKSRLAELYGNHRQRKAEKWHQQNRRKQTFGTITVVVGLLIVILALCLLYCKSKSKKLQLEERIKEERIGHAIRQKALGGRLKRSNETLLELKAKIKLQENEEEREDRMDIPFEEEPICKHIIQICNDERIPIKANLPFSSYADLALTAEQEAQLREAAVRHYRRLFERLKKNYPALKSKDYLYCYLCLLDLDNAQIAVLTHLSYRTVWEREKRLQRIFGREDRIIVILKSIKQNTEIIKKFQ